MDALLTGALVVTRDDQRRILDDAAIAVRDAHIAAVGRVRCQVAAHAPDNCSPWMLEALLRLAARHGLTRTIHLSQSIGEVAAVHAKRGTISAAYLARAGLLGPDLVAAH